MSLPFRVGGWVLGGSRWFFIITCHLFPMFFQRSMSLPFKVGGVVFWLGPGGSLGSACELPRPHDDVDADDDDDDDDDDDQRCGSALRLRANDGVEP